MNYFLTRLLAFLQCVVGFLMVVFGIVDKVENDLFTSKATFGIWIGLWVSKQCSELMWFPGTLKASG